MMKIVQVPKLAEDLNEAQLVSHMPAFSHQKVLIWPSEKLNFGFITILIKKV